MELRNRRVQSCWTCKRRKIGCDQGNPSCNNCIRTGRRCLGYALRLAWPDNKPDGRRRVVRQPQGIQFFASRSECYGLHFLNVTYADLAEIPIKVPLACNMFTMKSKTLNPWGLDTPCINERETYLITYYESRLSRMISTIDVNNGFREALLPIALSDSNFGLRSAILALAALHLWGPQPALLYKTNAIRSLSSSLSLPLSSDTISFTAAQLATSMMLCVYNVFDETEGNWSLHLKGSSKILQQLAVIHGGFARESFLYNWFLYHEILGGFSNPVKLSQPVCLRVKRDAGFNAKLIIGSLGCSVEIMEIISYVNGLRANELRSESLDFLLAEQDSRSEEWFMIEAKLTKLEQHLDPYASQLPQHEQSRILTIAELYRLATFLYLQRTQDDNHSPEMRRLYLEQAFQILASLSICTSPWPLFIMACETETDEQRIQILQTLDIMDRDRHIGNVFVLRGIIETLWNQQDLQVDNKHSSDTKWWDMVDLNTAAPWFI